MRISRSCFECRRRRVRCTFLQPGQPCQACQSHNTPCQTQTSSSGQDRIREKISTEAEVRRLQKRLADVESQVNANSSSSSSSSSSRYYMYTQQQGEDYETEADLKHAGSAPLMNLLGNTLTVDVIKDDNNGTIATTVAENIRLQKSLGDLWTLLPDTYSLRYILTQTEPYWMTWPTFHFNHLKTGHGGVEAAVNFIKEALHSNDTYDNVKATLWLALCVQQMSQKWNIDTVAGFAKNLVKSYMRISDNILSINAEQDLRSITEVECRLMQHSLLLNQGKPQKAWLTIRNAINSACLQGYHCLPSYIEESSVGMLRKKYAWEQACQADCLMSLFLGLPVAIPTSSLAVVEERSSKFGSVDTRFVMMREMFRIANAIAERNQAKRMDDYSIAMKLDQDYQKCYAMMSNDWHDSTLEDCSSLPLVYQIYRMKLLVAFIGKSIHLPFLLKARSDASFHRSRRSVLKLSNDMMEAYIGLRLHKTTRFVMCELMDFQAFSAALTIAVELLSATNHLRQEDKDEDADILWQKVMVLKTLLKQTSVDLECTIAAQGANVLEKLFAAHNQPESFLKPFEAEIPYFGIVRITPNQINGIIPSTELSTSSGTSESYSSSSYSSSSSPLTSIFSADLFYPMSPSGEFQKIMDLLGDWTNPVDVAI